MLLFYPQCLAIADSTKRAAMRLQKYKNFIEKKLFGAKNKQKTVNLFRKRILKPKNGRLFLCYSTN